MKCFLSDHIKEHHYIYMVYIITCQSQNTHTLLNLLRRRNTLMWSYYVLVGNKLKHWKLFFSYKNNSTKKGTSSKTETCSGVHAGLRMGCRQLNIIDRGVDKIHIRTVKSYWWHLQGVFKIIVSPLNSLLCHSFTWFH